MEEENEDDKLNPTRPVVKTIFQAEQDDPSEEEDEALEESKNDASAFDDNANESDMAELFGEDDFEDEAPAIGKRSVGGNMGDAVKKRVRKD